MPQPFLLDTNAYALLFQNPKTKAAHTLETALTDQHEITFYLPKLVAMEIHSVLGKYRRGGVVSQQERCDRHIVALGIAGLHPCPHSFVRPLRKRMKAKVFRHLQKLLVDIEAQRGPIKATVLPLGADELNGGRTYLRQYADRLSFGSHDAVVAGTLFVARRNGLNLTLVTSDKGLKALCTAESLPVLDPAI